MLPTTVVSTSRLGSTGRPETAIFDLSSSSLGRDSHHYLACVARSGTGTPGKRVTFGWSSGLLLSVAVAVAVPVMVTGSHPAGPAGLTILLYPGLGLVAVGCWVSVVVHSIVVRRLPVGVVLAPLVGVLMASLVQTGAASRLRFALVERPAFESVVGRAPVPVVDLPDQDLTDEESSELEGAFPGPCPAWIGTLRIRGCSTFAAGYLFYDEAGSGFIDDGGVAYMPEGIPQFDVGNGSFESPQFRHLVGPWYAFASSW